MNRIPFFRGTDDEGNLPVRTRVAVGVLALAIIALAVDVWLGGGRRWEIEGMAVVAAVFALYAIAGKNDLRPEADDEEHLDEDAEWHGG